MNLFYVVAYTFESETSGLIKGIDEADKKIEGLKKNTKQADDETKKLGQGYLTLFQEALSFTNVVGALKNVINMSLDVAKNSSSMGLMANQMNIGVDTLDVWRKAVTESGGDVESFTNTMKNLSQRFNDPEKALLRFSKVLGGMSSFKAQHIGKMLGLDQSTIELLRKGKDNVQEIIEKYKKHGALTKEQVELSDKFNKELAISKNNFESLKTSIAMMFIPALTWCVEKLNALSDWANNKSDSIKDFFIALAAVVGTIFFPAIISAGAAALTATWSFLLMGASILAATWPFLLIGAAIAALALIVSDVIGYFKGYDSVTGELVKKFPILGTVLNGVKDILIALGQFLENVFTDPLGAINDLIAVVGGALINVWKDFLDLIFGEGTGDTVFNFIGEQIDMLVAAFNFMKKIFENVFGFIMKGINGVKGFISKIGGFFGSGGDEEVSNHVTFGGSEYLAETTSTPLASMTSSSISQSSSIQNKTSNVNISHVEVVTQANDSKELAQSLPEQLRGAVWQFNDGVI